jgi:uncharacterized membrane protein YqjE
MAEPVVHGRQDASVGELVSRVATDLSMLLRQELELAKAEVKQEATQAVKAAGMFGAGGVAGLLTLGFLSLALMFGLAAAGLRLWLAALVVALVWGAVAVAMLLSGRKEIQRVGPPERTIKTVKEDVQWLKSRGR